MSAFLLVYGLIAQDKVPSFISYSLRRALRLLPSIAVLVLVGYLIGDCWEFHEIDHSAPISSRISIILLLINNYFDQPKYGNFTGSLTWSCAADFHMSLIVFLIVVSLRRTTFSGNASKKHLLLAQRLKPVFIALIIISLMIRGVIFDKDTRNLLKLVIFLFCCSLDRYVVLRVNILIWVS
jgi:peptidoglycan/LPS O-acetylase OafA/YrhL